MNREPKVLLAATVFAILAAQTALGDDKTPQSNRLPSPATPDRILVWYAGEPDLSDTRLHDAATAIRRQGLIYVPRDIKQRAHQASFDQDMDLPALRKPVIEQAKKMFIQRGYVLPNGTVSCGVPWELTPTLMTVDEQVTLFISHTMEPMGGRQALLERLLAAQAAARAQSASIVAERIPPTANHSSKSASPRSKAMPKLQEPLKVNINSASKEKLEALPGIGPVKAQAIIDARPFKTTEDIMQVSGIKKGVFAKLKDMITVK